MKKISVRDMVATSLFVTLIMIGARIIIPIPNMPFTLQFLFTNLAGIILGGSLGAFSVFIYVLLGLIGVPVFTSGGGPGYIFNLTFGFLVGFIVGTYFGGKYIELKEKENKFTKLNIFIGSLINLFFVYSIGMIHYYFISHLYMPISNPDHNPITVFALFLYCFILAVPGDLFLCFLSAIVGKRVKEAVSKVYVKSNYSNALEGKNE